MHPNKNIHEKESTAKFNLLNNYVKDFYELGYCLIPNLFDQYEVMQISNHFDRLQKIASSLHATQYVRGTQFVIERESIQRVVWSCSIEPELQKLGTDSRISTIVAAILGSSKFDHLICQNHFKLPGDDVEFAWHQDTEHRRFGTELWKDVNGKGSYVQTVTAIDAMHLSNSPIMVIPKSSHLGHLALNVGNNRKKYVDETKLVPIVMEPGSVLFFGPYLIHGSLKNTSSQARRVFINGFSYPGANTRKYPGNGSGYSLDVKPSSN
ncbi:MAG: phytanoyl-CoA dioxygenase family protein [Oligoflexales bacterium]